jgi:adenylate kinase
MNLVLLGAPGCGKGTQAALLAEKYSLWHIAPGDILRGEKEQGTELGRLAAKYIDAGNLVPDDVVIKCICKALDSACRAGKGVILDGFPRTLKQAEALSEVLSVDLVLYFEVSTKVIIERLTARRYCPRCNAIYSLISKPPRISGLCDFCSAALLQRDDDSVEVITARLKNYRQVTFPLLNYYQKLHKLHKINGERSIDEVFAQACKIIEQRLLERKFDSCVSKNGTSGMRKS